MNSDKIKGKGESDETEYEVNLDSVMVKSFSTNGSADDADSFDFKDFSDEGEAKAPKEWIPIETMSPPGPIGPSSQSTGEDSPDYCCVSTSLVPLFQQIWLLFPGLSGDSRYLAEIV